MECVSSIKVSNLECFPQCSGLLITSYNYEKEESRFSKLEKYLMENSYSLTALTKDLPGIFWFVTKPSVWLISEFGRKSDIQAKIAKLSAEYWNYKGFYNFPDEYKGSRVQLIYNMYQYFYFRIWIQEFSEICQDRIQSSCFW